MDTRQSDEPRHPMSRCVPRRAAPRRLQCAHLCAALLWLGACASHDSTTLSSAPVATITLAITAVTIAPQQTLTVTATPRDAAGSPLTGRLVAWASSQPAVATIDQNGVVTGVAGGMTTLTATSEGKSASVTITVASPPPPPPPVSDTGCGARNLGTASELVGCVRQDELWIHMTAFQQIADANPGSDGHASRNSGEPGYLASVNYVADLMRSAGYRVTIQQYDYTYHGYSSVPLLSEVAPAEQNFALGPDFNITSNSGSGDVTAQLQPAAGIVIPAPATPNSTSSGCASSDFTGFVPGRVALIQRGACGVNQEIGLAVTAGAAAVVVFNEGSTGNTAASSCGNIARLGVPVVCLASYAVGQALFNQAQQGPTTVRVRIQPLTEIRPDYNLIADSPYGDSSSVVVVDAHLDAIFGAGMLDNASGSATILEIALKMAGTTTLHQLRYIWFGGEETGLFGSIHYTSTLTPTERSRIAFDVDADVTATPNYVYAIADPGGFGAGTFPANVVPASQVGNNDFASYFTLAGLPFESRTNGGTDSFEFALIGVPNTGILTGQDCCKSAADVTIFGGFTGNYEGNVPSTDGGCVDRPFRWCDNLSNNDPVVLTTVSKAFASVVFNLANDNTVGVPFPSKGRVPVGGGGKFLRSSSR
jgi:hypothetical protein